MSTNIQAKGHQTQGEKQHGYHDPAFQAAAEYKLETTSINIPVVAGNQLLVEFNCIPNNRPNSYGNFLAVWRNHDTIPWNDTDPLGYIQLPNNNSQGTHIFENIKIAIGVSYVVGYGVGPKLGAGQVWGNICSTGFIPADNNPNSYLTPSVSDVKAYADSVSMRFRLPAGATPKSNGAWVGIWETSQASYNQPPIASNLIGIDSSQGNAAINGVSILRGQTYTVALLTSGWKAGAGGSNLLTPIAATATFNT